MFALGMTPNTRSVAAVRGQRVSAARAAPLVVVCRFSPRLNNNNMRYIKDLSRVADIKSQIEERRRQSSADILRTLKKVAREEYDMWVTVLSDLFPLSETIDSKPKRSEQHGSSESDGEGEDSDDSKSEA